jgi:hypothetical protein
MDRNLALRLRLNKLQDCGILAPLLLYEMYLLTRHRVELLQGYLVIQPADGPKEICWHVWIRHENGTDSDIGMILAGLVDPEFDRVKKDYIIGELPEGTECSKDPESVKQFEEYLDNPKQFWSKVSKKMSDFRKSTFAKIRN